MSVENLLVKKDKWYMRPIFSVSEIEESIEFYFRLFDFEQSWKFEENNQTIVTQVNRGEFQLILTQNLDRIGNARVFISLESWELENLQEQIKEKKILFERTHWGYPSIKITDPDDNELLFPLSAEKAGTKECLRLAMMK